MRKDENMTHLAFVDCEATGLDPDDHEIWEVALILTTEDPTNVLQEEEWMLPVDVAAGNPMSLGISGFHDRHPWGWNNVTHSWPDDRLSDRTEFAIEFGKLTYGAHLIGAVPSFDEERLRRFLLRWGFSPGWHYHPIDIEAMAAGWLWGRYHATKDISLLDPLGFPLKSDELAQVCGVRVPAEVDRHTAMGDADWVWRWYCALTGY